LTAEIASVALAVAHFAFADEHRPDETSHISPGGSQGAQGRTDEGPSNPIVRVAPDYPSEAKVNLELTVQPDGSLVAITHFVRGDERRLAQTIQVSPPAGCQGKTGRDALIPIVRVAPHYPPHARAEGRVKLRLTVGADGSVVRVALLDSVPRGVFDQAAIRTAAQWRYCPPIPGTREYKNPLEVVMEFKLKR
jgi:TonB family protein